MVHSERNDNTDARDGNYPDKDALEACIVTATADPRGTYGLTQQDERCRSRPSPRSRQVILPAIESIR